ncbi:polysaccharide biosynthesis C-terminal domain-containing protein [Nonomuraea wenchangensis]|uniref:Multidrug-efflux transporter n=1 Tax=Nonomuraea wenchangensis TaxID=568860 RepID=A0A1I0GXV5_9ACTN|nr:MATE family efflux transporter [Nonomuraea wenchangensis]SET76090.1 multidrug resistance protein, MATE family [Nonomuraea wenchangensis]
MPSPHRTILRAAVPLFGTMSAGIVAQLVGTSLLGHQATAQLAAFTLAGAVLNPVTAAVAGGLRGAAPFVAVHRDRPAEAVGVLKDARWLALGLGAAGAGVMLAVPSIARAGGAPDEAVAELGRLPLLLALHVLLYAAGSGANGVLVALGRSRLVLWSGLAGTGTQVALSLALVPRMGVQGVGVALLGSTAVAVAVSNGVLSRLTGSSPWPGRPRARLIVRMARVGVPMSATLVIKFTVMGGVAYTAARTGVQGAAAHAILIALDGFLGLAAFAAAQAATPEIARAASPRDARRVSGAAVTIAAAGVLVGGLVLLLPGGAVLGAFTPDAAVLGLAGGLVPLLLAFSLVGNCGIVVAYGLVGLRRSTWQLASAGTGYGLLALTMTQATEAGGLAGLWTAMVASAVLIGAMQVAGFVRYSARQSSP